MIPENQAENQTFLVFDPNPAQSTNFILNSHLPRAHSYYLSYLAEFFMYPYFKMNHKISICVSR